MIQKKATESNKSKKHLAMKRCILIVGLPGSGKTTLMFEFIDILKKSGFKDICCVDDPKIESDLNYESQIVLVSDPWLCEESKRNKAISSYAKYGYEVDLIYFENNVKRAIHNTNKRKMGGDIRKIGERYIVELSKKYKPIGRYIFEVYRG